eukprot:gene28607-35492_t
MLSALTPPAIESVNRSVVRIASTLDGTEWGLTDSVNTMYQLSHNKPKCVLPGWMRSASSPLSVSEEHSSLVTITENIDTTSYSSSTTATPSPQQSVWYAILLDKGLIDLHHLLDAMRQGSTHSRPIGNLHWKMNILSRVVTVCNEVFAKRGLVWCDLKPSNFIVFPSELNGDTSSSHTNRNTDYRSSNKLYKWLQQSLWEVDDITVRAADLGSVFAEGRPLDKRLVSCTAKFIDPHLARAINAPVKDTEMDCEGVVTGEVTVCSANMVWSLGMSALQILDTLTPNSTNTTFWSSLDLRHSEQIYEYLLTAGDSDMQRDVDGFVGGLADRVCVEYASGMLRVQQEDRLSMAEIVCAVQRVQQCLLIS